jgi:hypothetical protein
MSRNKAYQGGGVPVPMPGGGGGEGPGGDGGGGGEDGTIDLGQPGAGPGPGIADMPQGGGAAPPSGPIYPSVSLEGDGALSKIADEGKSIIHHKVISRRQHVPQHGPHKGKQRHTVEMHLHSIKPIRSYKRAESKSKKSDDQEAMEKLMGSTEEE